MPEGLAGDALESVAAAVEDAAKDAAESPVAADGDASRFAQPVPITRIAASVAREANVVRVTGRSMRYIMSLLLCAVSGPGGAAADVENGFERAAGVMDLPLAVVASQA